MQVSESGQSQPKKRTLAVLQPGYLPWLGFFDQLRRSDVFVLYDDVQYDKNGWRNRNRIKSPKGPHWLTVPVRVSLGQRILDVEIDNRQTWARKHLGTIEQFYKKAPFFGTYFPALEATLTRTWDKLVDLDAALISQMASWLGIETEIVRCSELGVDGDRNLRLLNLCKHFKAERYLSGNAAQCYLDSELFGSNHIEVAWQDYQHPIYQQQYEGFEPYLSALDLLFNCGDNSKTILTGANLIEAK
jgi:hypothetical protein